MKFSILFLFFLASCGFKVATAPSYILPENDPNQISQEGEIKNFKLTCEEARFITLLNIYRQSQNVGTLKVSKSGIIAGRWHAQDMIDKNYFAHSEPNGRDFSTRVASFGYPGWAENIAAGGSTASATFCMWKLSSGHNSNMLSSQHTTTGIGQMSGGGTYGTYWSSNFGPDIGDNIATPLTDTSCELPSSLPSCG